MEQQRGTRGLGTFELGKDGLWHGYVPLGVDARTKKRERVHIHRADRQEAMHLFLRTRSVLYIRKHGLHSDVEPPSAAEWLWCWTGSYWLRKASGIFPHHVAPVERYVIPGMDERRLCDFTATDIADLLNRVPTLHEKSDALRVLSEALLEARKRGWIQRNPVLDVQLQSTTTWVFDPYTMRPPDPGRAVVQGAI